MSTAPQLFGSPPRRRRRSVVPIDPGAEAGAQLRKREFWAGWGGVLLSLLTGGFVVALLVGWVLLWVQRQGGPSVVLLTLGCIAFTLVLGLLAMLQSRLKRHWRLRQVEAAFLTGVSHNLRTPISAIRVAAQALERPDLTSEQRGRLLAAIVYQTRRLSLRVDNVIEVGRLEVERTPFGVATLDLGDVARASADSVVGVVESRGGSLSVELDEPLPVHADARATRLLVDNLVDNALKYTDGPPVIRIAGARHGAFFVLSVIDGGMGFRPEAVTQLFRRFRSGDTGRQGVGLGLGLSRAIARGHGGDIHLHSDGPGTGAQAEVWLPAAKEG